MTTTETKPHWCPDGGAAWYLANRTRCAHRDCAKGPLFYTSKPGEFDVLMCEGHAREVLL
jgi:hypothetical protein